MNLKNNEAVGIGPEDGPTMAPGHTMYDSVCFVDVPRILIVHQFIREWKPYITSERTYNLSTGPCNISALMASMSSFVLSYMGGISTPHSERLEN
jgi:hypothetical protein